MLKKSPIKQRILEYVRKNYASRRDFYTKTGISRGTLENNSGITEDTLTKLFSHDKNLSPVWILTGEGEMLKDAQKDASILLSGNDLNFKGLCEEKNNRINELKDRVQEQTEFIKLLMQSDIKKKSQ